MRSLAIACALLTLPACLVAHAGGSVTATVGARFLDEDREPVETQFMFGLLGDVQLGRSPLYVEWGLRGSADEGRDGPPGDRSTLTAAIADLSVGLLLRPQRGRVRPYFSAGISSVGFSLERDDDNSLGADEDDDQSIGYYVASGLLFRVGRGFELGLDARYLGGTDFTLFEENDPARRGVKVDVDSFTIGLRAGYGWGGSASRSSGSSQTVEPVPVTASAVAPMNERAEAALQACNHLLRQNRFATTCDFTYSANQVPTLTARLPSMADIRANNRALSAQVVDPFCAATRQGPQAGVVSIQIPATRQSLEYNCGLSAWGSWVSQ